jgi:hypothetical protein
MLPEAFAKCVHRGKTLENHDFELMAALGSFHSFIQA